MPGPSFLSTVEQGDTLWSIVRRFGTTADAIAAANDLEDPSKIEVGWVLAIPGTPPPTTTVPTPNGTAAVFRRGPSALGVVALTLDAGSDAGHTDEILDTLGRYRVTAWFGLTGRWVEANPSQARRIAEEGHLLSNHSYDHPSFTGYSTGTAPLNEAKRRSEVERAEEAIIEHTGLSPRPAFRPPYGDYDPALTEQLPGWGYSLVMMWTVDSLGWKVLPAEEIATRCLERAAPGAIFLFHVGSASADHAALPTIIDGLRDRGLEPVSLFELLDG